MTRTGTGTKLALVDVDGTLTHAVSIWQHLMENTGCWDGAGEVNLARFLSGEIGYHEFCDLDAKLFEGQRYADLTKIAHSVPIRAGADTMLDHLRGSGYHVALVSTGLRLLTSYFTDRFAIPTCVVNDLAQRDGICTGEAIINVEEHGKGLFARQLIDEHQPDHVVAIGDSKGDLPLFAAADLAIAVAPLDQRVRDATTVQISGDDLSELRDVL